MRYRSRSNGTSFPPEQYSARECAACDHTERQVIASAMLMQKIESLLHLIHPLLLLRHNTQETLMQIMADRVARR
jgi:hypothetical protein